MTKIYVTKYALTTGPFQVDAEVSPGVKKATIKKCNGYLYGVYGKDFWLTPEEAISDCERRRDERLKSLEKQKAKLEKLTFSFDKVIK